MSGRPPSPIGRLIRAVVAALLAAAFAGCAVSEDAGPRDIPLDDLGNFGVAVAGGEAVGTSRIYLLAPSDGTDEARLRSVARDVPAEPVAVLESLISGPNADELAAQLLTAIPPELAIRSARTIGRVLTVDMNDALGELRTDGLRLALAQIVNTAGEIEGVEAVRLRVDGENRPWPTGNLELVERPLTTYDYPGLVESTQPAYPAIPSRT